MHDRLSLSALCFPEMSAADALSTIADLGVRHTTLLVRAVKTCGSNVVQARADAVGVTVEAVITGPGPMLDDPTTWPASRDQLMAGIELATELGAKTDYMLTGYSRATWPEAVERFSAYVAPCLEQASAAGVTLAIEPAHFLYSDMTFVNSAAAGLALCRAVPGMNICFDVFHAWTEFDLHQSLISNASLINLVQVSDFVLGDRTPARAVPGDGGIPLEEVIGWLLHAGYDGVFDLELNGPRIDAEGHLEAARRGVQVLNAILEQYCPNLA